MPSIYTTSSDLTRALCESMELESPRQVSDAIPDDPSGKGWYGRGLSASEFDFISREVWAACTDGAEWPWPDSALEAAIRDQELEATIRGAE